MDVTPARTFLAPSIRKVWNRNGRGRRVRGASTISQQTAKNAFLWVGRSYFRKGLESYFTAMIELTWGKRRIMEVYLNIIEFGPGIFGAEAAARRESTRTRAASGSRAGPVGA